MASGRESVGTARRSWPAAKASARLEAEKTAMSVRPRARRAATVAPA